MSWPGEKQRHALSARGIKTSIPPIAIPWTYPDAKYKAKSLNKYRVELIYGTDRGGVIYIWQVADKDEIEAAKKLPHIFVVKEIDGIHYDEVAQAHFMHWENALEEYREIKSDKDAFNLVRRTI